MRPILSRTEMRSFDERAIHAGMPGVVLMENAGRGAVDAIASFVERRGLLRAPRAAGHYAGLLSGLRVVVSCGAGNNGGDGYVVARRLLTLGAEVRVFSAVPCSSLKGDAATMCHAFGVLAGVSEDMTLLRPALEDCDLAVDALFGTGLSRPLTGTFAELVTALNEAKCPVVSLDVPSGLDAESGRGLGVAVRAALTVTFGYAKRGHFSSAGHELSGELEVVDIGVPEEPRFSSSGNTETLQLIERADVVRLLGERSVVAHKGDSGRVVVVAGSEGKLGAARLSARGALRGGAGLVTVLTRAAVAVSLEHSSLEEMTERLDEAQPSSSLARFERVDAFVLGPGLGRDDFARRTVEAVLERPEPVVIDADALHLVKDALESIAARGPRVLTPHPGEAAALLGISPREVEEDRFGAAALLSSRSRSVVVLKGSRTLIAAPDAPMLVSGFGSPVLATGGTGDVLSGLLGACLVQREARGAALLGVALHALAGEHRARTGADRGVLAHEVADAVPSVIASLLGRDVGRAGS